MKLLGVLAQSGVVLLDEVPADLILGQGLVLVLGSGGSSGGGLGCRAGRCVLVAVINITVCCHDCGGSGKGQEES